MHPLVKRRIAAVQQINCRHPRLHECILRHECRNSLSPTQASRQIILPRLCHDRQSMRQLFSSDILRIKCQQALSDLCKFAGRILKNKSVGSRRQKMLRYFSPLGKSLWRVRTPNIADIPRRHRKTSDTIPRLRQFPPRRITSIGTRQLPIDRLHCRTVQSMIPLCQPDTKARSPIMIPRYRIVITQALGPLSCKSHRHTFFQFWQIQLKSRSSNILPVVASQCQTIHAEVLSRKRCSSCVTACARSLPDPNSLA